jgi:hypothetical protein
MMMKTVVAAIVLSLAAAPALAKKPWHRAPDPAQACTDNWPSRSLLETLFSNGPAPQANGCSPAVYNGSEYVGQDPDPNVRLQLRRDPDIEGFHYGKP